ncbi:MAG: hypothetical protein WC836_24060, partial [Desulfobacula sp.]
GHIGLGQHIGDGGQGAGPLIVGVGVALHIIEFVAFGIAVDEARQAIHETFSGMEKSSKIRFSTLSPRV